nr:immunoglobulin heavy chain junction region [Macaca mulatta]MOW19742.1 immunoglobulin heavy chain junction region [Macaca mulatta]MOW19835.1 immunoglobulin heavy chain junction region [Macaca mulatta]MOW21970.1 immunoglobulin heavy chain junction region [Macaca mulatta]MOW22307.1 immunoglobulin heavy chain junction region [Macaca mulatta]
CARDSSYYEDDYGPYYTGRFDVW